MKLKILQSLTPYMQANTGATAASLHHRAGTPLHHRAGTPLHHRTGTPSQNDRTKAC